MEGIIYRNLYDEDGAIISLDGKTLLKVPDASRYRVPEGIEEIDIKAVNAKMENLITEGDELNKKIEEIIKELEG